MFHMLTLSASLAEETKDPHRAVPRAIVFATVFTYVGGWLFNIVLAFCLGSPTELLASPVGQPVRFRFSNSFSMCVCPPC